MRKHFISIWGKNSKRKTKKYFKIKNKNLYFRENVAATPTLPLLLLLLRRFFFNVQLDHTQSYTATCWTSQIFHHHWNWNMERFIAVAPFLTYYVYCKVQLKGDHIWSIKLEYCFFIVWHGLFIVCQSSDQCPQECFKLQLTIRTEKNKLDSMSMLRTSTRNPEKMQTFHEN